ncbi:spore coat protein U domain-containing protein [Pusillimonas sp. ANT_WB101]|uniref:Csu type fimbrial protein n=1 Tax=Pusillimonas sp. ANT_WB101 TaxID=2597356 RepID=UPI0011F0587E|nr:spore coat protein U domain-containing protein [Pusillimonas sp. ANT_WB101]KAA0891098.1 spore coat protein U domain-containing protein [Pusillimonas sp. ANT_WB101]
MKRSLIALALVSSFAAVGVANAASSTANFNVTINVAAGCEFKTPNSIGDLSFGTVAATPLTGSAPVTLGQTSFEIQCTVGTAPGVALASANSWKMKGVNGTDANAFVDYSLFSNEGRTASWSGAIAAPIFANGQPQTMQVYGKVTNPGRVAGSFKDVVTVTLTY